MTKRILMLAALLAAGAAHAQSEPDRTEQLIWQGAMNANTANAYSIYLKRYPNGTFADMAREAAKKLGPVPAPVAAPAPPRPAVATAPPAPASTAGEVPAPTPYCANAVNPTPEMPIGIAIPPGELAVYREASAANRFATWRGFLAAYPTGVCQPEVDYFMRGRIARWELMKASVTPGAREARRTVMSITADDYPPSALRANQQGITQFAVEVAEDGRVDGCMILMTSGSDALDAQTCRLYRRRARFDPARDAAGMPVPSTVRLRTIWTLPE